MMDMRDMTWRFINLAPTVANQTALDSLFAETLKPFALNDLIARASCRPPRTSPRGSWRTAA